VETADLIGAQGWGFRIADGNIIVREMATTVINYDAELERVEDLMCDYAGAMADALTDIGVALDELHAVIDASRRDPNARAGSRAGGRGGPAGAGSRAGTRGPGGAGGRGAGKKNDKKGSQDQDWQADYTDDWTDPNYQAWDPEMGRGWVPNQNDEDVDKKDTK
jgi:hypothetical protein